MYLCVQVCIGYQWLQVFELPRNIDVICMLLRTATDVVICPVLEYSAVVVFYELLAIEQWVVL